MNQETSHPNLPDHLFLLQDPDFADPDDPARPNRLCICFSDVHFTDGSVGDQNAEIAVWHSVFERIKDLCAQYQIAELTLLLAGDSIDMIRTAKWSQHNVYPWQRDDPQYRPILNLILDDIVRRHAQAPQAPLVNPGFFHLLRQLPEQLQNHQFRGLTSPATKVQTLVLLGNHDKDLLSDPVLLERFYVECLGVSLEQLQPSYRAWIGNQYFNDAQHFAAADSAPWLPFYWADRGFRLFVTHGHWRDADNCRAVAGWKVRHGWNLAVWQKLKFAPFTEPCFGDTVAAGVLSGFIARSTAQIEQLADQLPDGEAHRLCRVLAELDLYRPVYLAIARIIQETRRLQALGTGCDPVRLRIERELIQSLDAWLSWPFTYQSARTSFKIGLWLAARLLALMKNWGSHFELSFLYFMFKGMAQVQSGFTFGRDMPSYRALKSFPGFLESYRDYGFRIHGEGHTHIPLQTELYFPGLATSKLHKSYSYINFGSWRDQIVSALQGKFRRQEGGRLLGILDLQADGDQSADDSRAFSYFVEDVLIWSDKLDRL